MTEAEKLEDEGVAEQLEQVHLEEWASTTTPDGRTYFSQRRSGRVRWTLPPFWRLRWNESGGSRWSRGEDGRGGHCSAALHDVSLFSPHCGMQVLRFRSPWCCASWSIAERYPISTLHALVCGHVFVGKDALSLSWFGAHVFIAVEMPQFQSIVRVLDILAVPQRWVPTVQTVLKIAEIPTGAVLGYGGLRARWCATTGADGPDIADVRCESAVAVHRQGRRHPC